MKVLVVGSGGREHALAWKLRQSSRVSRVYCAPGNAGTADEGTNVDIAATDIERLVRFAKSEGIDLTVVGPEAPLVAGIVDAFQDAGLTIFGPTAAAARLEGSKSFAKQIMRRANVPTADFRTFDDPEAAAAFLQSREDQPWVVKADGLAAGKGVTVCRDRAEALQAVRRALVEGAFGEAGRTVVIEECLQGEEASILAIVDGTTIVPLESSQDHKRAYDGDRGPNTGGMGAYSPCPLIDDATMDEIAGRILVPTVHAMREAGTPFRGVLYAGLMMTGQGPKVLEFNVRFGDPEAQPVLMRLQSDLLPVLEAAARGRLADAAALRWDPRPAVCVVMASEGYPGAYETGFPIRGLEEAARLPNVKVFHAGTARRNGEIVTAGGRVLGVTALGEDLADAKLQAYRAVKCIRWKGAWCRKDISDKARKWL
ncbi:MAG: phosphoribosylamine--glycine ligase [Planctomycetota bacterium]|nr:MAG: phosphoribosylamine--glycine ligase [Planctomycetota bacterium]